MQKNNLFVLIFAIGLVHCKAQDLTVGLQVNDLALHPMQDIAKPAYLETITDPSFGTTIRRISDAPAGNSIVPMYSTIQAWNADETMMILYDVGLSEHRLLDGMNYTPIRMLDDVEPKDLEQIFWDFNDPNIFYYPEISSNAFIKYEVDTQIKAILLDMDAATGCTAGIAMGNDVQMMSWDSDVFSFRCGSVDAYSYRISTNQLTTFNINSIGTNAPMPGPSGNTYYHNTDAYDMNGDLAYNLNEASVEHACEGKLANGNDAHLVVAFADGPQGGCGGNIVAHDLTTGACFSVVSEGQGYDYSQSGTHISALAHKNISAGWMCASMMGYDKDGQELLDQELIIARADQGNIQVCRIGHHRSDEDETDYWGEPHAVISPTGTRVLFGSDWSGAEDGLSIDSYVVELPAFELMTSSIRSLADGITVHPNPFTDRIVVSGVFTNYEIKVLNSLGQLVTDYTGTTSPLSIDLDSLGSGMYFVLIQSTVDSEVSLHKIIKQ